MPHLRRNHRKVCKEKLVPPWFKFFFLTFAVGIVASEVIADSSNLPNEQLAFLPTKENKVKPVGPQPIGMVWIPGGEFSMGSGSNTQTTCPVSLNKSVVIDTQPVHRVYVDGFWMDEHEVTNEDFEKFVNATGYVTVAERTPSPEAYPGISPELIVSGSLVFSPPKYAVSLENPHQWWSFVKGANWRHPFGPSSTIKGKEMFPVVHIAYEDAVSYAKWAGKRLPTEAEFEFAARAGLTGTIYPWGNELRQNGRYMANTFQGSFPFKDTAEDGFAGIAPVRSFPPNGYGLYDISGNVWEWCSDWYRSDYYKTASIAHAIPRNPVGPDSSYDPSEPFEQKRVQRGGSFLCSDQYCSRYTVGARGKGEPTTGTVNLGFRCVK